MLKRELQKTTKEENQLDNIVDKSFRRGGERRNRILLLESSQEMHARPYNKVI